MLIEVQNLTKKYGTHTAELSYKNDAERLEAARMAARTWNYRKVIRPNPGE